MLDRIVGRIDRGIRVDNRRKKIGTNLSVIAESVYIGSECTPGVWYAWRHEKISLRVERIQALLRFVKRVLELLSSLRKSDLNSRFVVLLSIVVRTNYDEKFPSDPFNNLSILDAIKFNFLKFIGYFSRRRINATL